MMQRLTDLVGGLSGHRVLVVGDLVADDYIYGRTDRISREAPVLILKFVSQTLLPGGAANAVMNVRSLGAAPVPCGVVGDDDMGAALREIFQRNGIDCSHLLTVPDRSTTIKTRILAGGIHTTKQQVIRIDRETKEPLPAETIREIICTLNLLIKDVDAVLVSDYGYGMVGEAVKEWLAGVEDVPVLVDSRYDLLDFHGITLATPNEEEVIWALGRSLESIDELEKAGWELIEKLNSPALLITRGSSGMSLFLSGKSVEHIPICGSDEIADVTGAGDTVAAVVAAALAAGADFSLAAHLANVAGGIVVMKRGPGTVTQEELLDVLREDKQ